MPSNENVLKWYLNLKIFLLQQPDYLNISDWFSGKGSFKGEDLKALHGVGLRFDPRNAGKFVLNEELNNNVKKAAKEIIDEQINIGIDVITDGEVERGNFI